eukprot:CAMPEP_0179214028 /NCGR_PEP_ID=MMETSP0797-20121207/2042_1 /TAXON_ID=47934 /ORGANISM="Dinophysis acuminata, Strain DAEP01" /LENGTH=339 /DNA_ID=CAMNT_0020919923 /DNA_START=39 /DNA_END=1057 /DNA_ORIENTATION=+
MARPALKLEGTITALVTPFKADGEVDYDSLRKLVEMNIREGVNGLIPMGTTGESPTVSKEEYQGVIKCVIEAVNKRVPVIAGAGSNCTSKAVEDTKFAKAAGADAVLSVNPYYNKPNQQGLFQHFEQVAAVGIPIVLYNIPGRTNITMTAATVAKLYEACPQIIAVKDSTGNLDNASEVAALCPGITILSGDDSLTLPLMSVGARGVVSVLANLAPKLMLGITDAVLKEGDWEKAKAQHVRIFKLCKALFLDPNPCPVKLALAKAGVDPDPGRQAAAREQRRGRVRGGRGRAAEGGHQAVRWSMLISAGGGMASSLPRAPMAKRSSGSYITRTLSARLA